MRRKLTCMVALSAVIVAAALATPPVGFVGTTLAVGRLGEVDVFNHFIPPGPHQDGDESHPWISFQKAKGSSDLYVQSNVWEPGGSTGWHTHPGHSLIIVTAGTITAYEGADAACKGTTHTQGTVFVDPGGDHAHVLRNEGSVEARTITVQLIPAGAVRRIDVENPRNCPF